jgi:hypothetical protein
MTHYALIFYSTRTITPEEQKQRPKTSQVGSNK